MGRSLRRPVLVPGCGVADQAQQSPQSRLLAAGFSRRLEWWVTPDGAQVLGLDDAIAGLDTGEITPGQTVSFPDTGVRALPDELVDRMFDPPPPPPPDWLEPCAELLAEKLKPVVRAEVRSALRAGARGQARERTT
jgi:hypothetical protein